jgi:transposase
MLKSRLVITCEVTGMRYGGLDAHKDFVQACWVDERNKVVREERFDTTPNGMARLRKAAQDTRCVIESSTSCYQTYDALKDAGVRIRVAHPLRVKAIAFAKIKTDKTDARTLAELERADLIPEAHIPSKETRNARLLVRQRVFLTKEATRLKNRARCIFLKQGIKTPPNLFTRHAWAETVAQATGNAKLAIDQLKAQLDFLHEQREELNDQIQRTTESSEDAKLLQTIPGIGPFSALLLATEIDGVHRFNDEEHLQSYAGLVPSTRQSGNTSHSGHISKQGNKLIRWVLVQDAWITIRKSEKFRKTFIKISRKKGSKIAIVAVARKMLRAAYVMLCRRQAFSEDA